MKKRKVASGKTSTLTLRVKNADEAKALTVLKELLNEKTSTGALMRAAIELPKAVKANQELTVENNKLKEKLNQVSTILSNWIESQNSLISAQKSIKQLHKPY